MAEITVQPTATQPAAEPRGFKHHPPAVWLQARQAYVRGEGYLTAIAERFGIPLATVQTRAKSDKWGAMRDRYLESKEKELPPEQPAVTPAESPAGYVNKRLLRVREGIEQIDALLDTEKAPKRMRDLVAAQADLAEQERLLDNRPLPGSCRPAKQSRREVPPEVEPID